MKTRLPQLAVPAAACCSILGPSQALAQGRAGAAAKVSVGTVERAERVRLDSDAGSGVLVGGTLGLLSASGKSGGKKARNAIIGATGGAMIAGAAQGSREGMAYTVTTGPGTRIKVISDQTGILVGDCVAVEEAGRLEPGSGACCKRPRPVKKGPRVGLAPRSDVAVAADVAQGQEATQSPDQEPEALILRGSEGAPVVPLKFDAQ